MDPALRAVLINLPGLALPILAFLSLRYARPNRPYGRVLLLQAVGFGVWAAAGVLWTLKTAQGPAPWPGPIDALALLGYLAFVLSNVLFLKLLHDSGLVKGIANSVLGALMVLALYGYLMIGIGEVSRVEGLPFVVSLLYRFLDVFVLSLTTINAVFLLRIRESFVGQFQLTLAIGFVLMALGNAFNVAILLRTGSLDNYTFEQGLMVTAFYVSSHLILTTGYVLHWRGVRRHFSDEVPEHSLILREALLGAYENALADLIEYVRQLFGTRATAGVRNAAHKLGAGPTTEIEIGPSGLPTRVLSEPEWRELLMGVRKEYVLLGGALMNPIFDKIRSRYGEKLSFLEPVLPLEARILTG